LNEFIAEETGIITACDIFLVWGVLGEYKPLCRVFSFIAMMEIWPLLRDLKT